MDRKTYALENTGNLISPALVYYKDIILANTKRIIEMAGGPQHLWPHMKSHKITEMINMQIALGITRFKCATIAEAEITAAAGAEHIIFAYPLIGPNVSRLLELAKAYPKTVFYAIGDNFEQLSILAAEACRKGMDLNVLVDVDIGMHRTGVPVDMLESLYERCASLKGISVKGMHCYDGQCNDRDFGRRKAMAEENDRGVLKIRESLEHKGLECGLMVMGGSPSFPCRTASMQDAGRTGFYLSPGTIFIGDWGYYSNQPDMAFTPGAAVFCRVVSHPAGNSFTLDLGHKGIAADPAGARGVIAGLEEAKPLFQSEEHWVFSIPENTKKPPIGSECYVIPTHICPTSALYPEIQVAQGGKIIERWQVSARNRRINY
jgi:D-serine deaminase-like pyridoxal phosphate-dependent protein